MFNSLNGTGSPAEYIFKKNQHGDMGSPLWLFVMKYFNFSHKKLNFAGTNSRQKSKQGDRLKLNVFYVKTFISVICKRTKSKST